MDAEDSNNQPFDFQNGDDRYDLGNMFDCVPQGLQSAPSQFSLPKIQPSFFTQGLASNNTSDGKVTHPEQPTNNKSYQSMIPKAVNYSDLPFYSQFINPKRAMGLQHLFVDESQSDLYEDNEAFKGPEKEGDRFLERIDSRVFGNSSNSQYSLETLFGMENQKKGMEIQSTLLELRKRIEEIQHRSLSSINLNRTISNSFYQHFSNFSLLFSSTNFSANLSSSLESLIANCSKLHSPSIDLITSLYEFWMRQFRQFVQEIWRCSQKYTLGVFKKKKEEERQDRSISEASSNQNNQNRGTSSIRKPWTADQLRILEELINSNIIFSQSVLKKLSNQLSRSPSSISSKIQKLQKSLNPNLPQSSLLSRMIHTLKINPAGLTRQTLIQKINQNYQMGYGGSWQKSVGQLLSRPQFNRIKGRYKLIGNSSMGTGDKSTFKDRVVECLMRCQGMQATLQTIVNIYCQLYPEQQTVGVSQSQRIKSIQANISKTLSRYDIFDCSNSRTVYTLASTQHLQEDQVQKYLQL